MTDRLYFCFVIHNFYSLLLVVSLLSGIREISFFSILLFYGTAAFIILTFNSTIFGLMQ